MTRHVSEVKKLSRIEIARPLASSALEEKQIDLKQIWLQSAINLRVYVNKSSIPSLCI